MTKIILKRSNILLVSTLLLSACGKTGALYLPDAQKKRPLFHTAAPLPEAQADDDAGANRTETKNQ